MRNLLLLLTILACSACANTAKTASGDLPPEGEMLLTSVLGYNVASKGLTFTFNPEKNRVSGETGCNGFSANYKREETKISFHAAMSTKMYCANNMEIEDKILSTLPEVFKFVRDGNEFLFYSEKGELLFTLKKYRSE